MQADLKNKKNDNPSIKDIQNKILEIFKVIADICEKNDIRYFAIGGTCIGAARHKGFIPWDDDLDIAMPLNDFLKFKRIAAEQLPPHLKLFDANQSLHYNHIFMKVHDVTTTFIEESLAQYPDTYYGVYVDIMPLSGLPDIGSERKRFFMKRLWFEKLNDLRRRSIKERNKIWGKLIWILHSPLRLILPFNFYTNRWLKLLEKYDFDSASYTGYVWSHNLSKLVFDKTDFEDFVYLDFEDTKIRCPKGWNDYLTVQFGDYMQLPSLEEQTFKHPAIIDLQRSYLEYSWSKDS